MTLFINACVRKGSRTERLARHLLGKLGKDQTELRLSDVDFPSVDGDFIEKRDELISRRLFDSPMFGLARLFASADSIVIAAPFWDLSFPAALKQYFEQINVVGLTFRYTPEGAPQGLCRAKELYYVTTSGGPVFDYSFGYGYVKSLAEGFYSIPRVELFSAEGLDIIGSDVEGILKDAERRIDAAFETNI